MGDKTGISWTDATCSACAVTKPLAAFASDKTHANGRTSVCRDCRNAKQRATYTPKPVRSRRGILLAPTRDGDKKQARSRVNHLVETGQIPRPEDVGCMDCGDAQGFPSARHEYDQAVENFHGACDQAACDPSLHGTAKIASGPGSKRKAGGVIELPYLDGVQHAAFPEAR